MIKAKELFEESCGLGVIKRLRSQRGIAECYSDNFIVENNRFDINLILPHNHSNNHRYNRVIFLFHGLNERSWEKYIPWAKTLVNNIGVPVVLFPISFHINRSPLEWSNARAMQKRVEYQQQLSQENGTNCENLSFVNYALSSRIKSNPLRFFIAGKETIFNICQFIKGVKKGNSAYISPNFSYDIFSYSIGSLLSQVLLMSNAQGLFRESKLFIFCGGSLLSKMNGNSKLIMDKNSYERLDSFYKNDFIDLYGRGVIEHDAVNDAFVSHINEDLGRDKRANFYKENYNRIKVIALAKDSVISIEGIKEALGSVWPKSLRIVDFPFEYRHETPFPLGKEESQSVEPWFQKVFAEAINFFKA